MGTIPTRESYGTPHTQITIFWYIMEWLDPPEYHPGERLDGFTCKPDQASKFEIRTVILHIDSTVSIYDLTSDQCLLSKINVNVTALE